MADDLNQGRNPGNQGDTKSSDTKNSEEQLRRELRRDPEFEMPDPEQVDRDIAKAEKTYKGDDKDKSEPEQGLLGGATAVSVRSPARRQPVGQRSAPA